MVGKTAADATPTAVLGSAWSPTLRSQSQCFVDGRNQRGSGELLLQISNASHLFRFRFHGAGFQCRDENHRKGCPLGLQPALQIDAGHATEVDIKDKAVYRRFGIASEKGLG